MTTTQRYAGLAVALVLIVGSIVYLDSQKAHRGSGGDVATLSSDVRTDDFAARAEKYAPAVEISNPSGFVNTGGQPLALKDIVGKKVILLDFWTYSCINCQRTLPYLTSWYEKYRDQGLEIVGVHTPEFAFEKDIENVKAAAEKYGIEYPIVLDNDYATWDAYKNQYWPEHYLIDINGLVVDRHIGEGGYEETERKIQDLLRERAKALGEDVDVRDGVTSVDQDVDAGSPETYFGWSRNGLLANGQQSREGLQQLALPAGELKEDALYLGGTWSFSNQYAASASDGARIAYSYDARDVYFVASADAETTITVMRDGRPVSAERGEDVREDGTAVIKEARLYKLIHEQEPGKHRIDIIVSKPGMKAFTFTFG